MDPNTKDDGEGKNHPEQGALSPAATDRVFPIRSVVSVDATPTPGAGRGDRGESYFQNLSHARRGSASTPNAERQRQGSEQTRVSSSSQTSGSRRRKPSTSTGTGSQPPTPGFGNVTSHQQLFSDMAQDTGSVGSGRSSRPQTPDVRQRSGYASSVQSTSTNLEDAGPLMTARFKHVVTEGGKIAVYLGCLRLS